MAEIPKVKENIDWSNVIIEAEDHIRRVFSGERVHEDEDHYLFEALLEAMYGKDIFEKYRACMDNREY